MWDKQCFAISIHLFTTCLHPDYPVRSGTMANEEKGLIGPIKYMCIKHIDEDFRHCD